MSISFPTSLDSFANPVGTDLLENATAALDHDVQHSNANDAIEALEAKVGINSSAVTTSHDYKLSAVTSTAKALTSGTSTQSVTGLTLVSPTLTLISDATGDMYYRNSGGALTRLPIGTSGQIIQTSSSGIPEWIANPSAADASTTVKGVVEEATQAEVNAGTAAGGTSARLFVNPSTLSTWLSTQNTSFLSVVSGENISANMPVYINPLDSSVYTAHGFKEVSSATTFTHPSTITNAKTAKLSDTQFMVLSNTSNTLTITVFDSTAPTTPVATSTVSTTMETTYSTTTYPSATVCRMTDTTFVVFYSNTTNGSFRFRTGSISGGTITMDTDTAFPSAPTYCYGFSVQPNLDVNGDMFIAYTDGTNVPNTGGASYDSVLSHLTVATNSVTVNTTTSFTLTSGTYWVIPRWSAVCFTNNIAYGLFSVGNSGGLNEVSYNYINTVDNSTSSNNYTINLESETGSGIPSTYSSVIPYFAGHNGKGYFGWATNNGGTPYVNTKTVLEISQVGCKVKYQTTAVKLAGDTTVAALPMFGNEMGVIVSKFPIATSGSSLNGSIYIQKDNIYSFYSTVALGIDSNLPAAQAWYVNRKDEVIVCQQGLAVKTWRIPTPVDGFVTSSVTAPASATIYNSTATTTGLTANAQYYLKDTYTTVGDTAFIGTIPFADALSSTVLKLK